MQENDVGYNQLKQKPSPIDMRSVQAVKKEMEQKSTYSIKHNDAGAIDKESKQTLAIRARKQTKARRLLGAKVERSL